MQRRAWATGAWLQRTGGKPTAEVICKRARVRDAQVQTADPGPQHGPTNQPRYLPCDLFSWPLQEVSKGAQPVMSGVLQGVDWERYARGEGSLKTEPQRHFPVGSETKKGPVYSRIPRHCESSSQKPRTTACTPLSPSKPATSTTALILRVSPSYSAAAPESDLVGQGAPARYDRVQPQCSAAPRRHRSGGHHPRTGTSA